MIEMKKEKKETEEGEEEATNINEEAMEVIKCLRSRPESTNCSLSLYTPQPEDGALIKAVVKSVM